MFFLFLACISYHRLLIPVAGSWVYFLLPLHLFLSCNLPSSRHMHYLYVTAVSKILKLEKIQQFLMMHYWSWYEPMVRTYCTLQMSSMDHNPQKAFKVKANNSLQTLEETQRNLNHLTSEVQHKPSLMNATIGTNLYNSCSYQIPKLDSAGWML